MATCKNCGRPLIQNGGRCVYCNHPVYEGTSGGKVSKPSWIKAVTTSLTSKQIDWTQFMVRKTIISIIVSMLLGILTLYFMAWPGCFVSVSMFVLAIILSIYSFLIINLDQKDVDENEKKQKRVNLSHGLNIILLWGGFFFVLGIICMFISWWAVLIVELFGVTGMIAVAGMAEGKELKFIKY